MKLLCECHHKRSVLEPTTGNSPAPWQSEVLRGGFRTTVLSHKAKSVVKSRTAHSKDQWVRYGVRHGLLRHYNGVQERPCPFAAGARSRTARRSEVESGRPRVPPREDPVVLAHMSNPAIPRYDTWRLKFSLSTCTRPVKA